MTLTGTTATLTTAVATCRDALGDVTGHQPAFLSLRDKERLLVELVALETQVTELRMRTLAAAGDIATAHGARDTATWIAHHTNVAAPRLRAEARVADSVDRRWGRVATAMARGRLTLDQARVITTGLDALPDHIGPEARDHAERDLVALATGDYDPSPERGFGPHDLRRLADRILHVVAPEVADAEDAKRLAALEAHARAKTSLKIRHLHDTDNGLSRVTALVPHAVAARLATYLDAYTSPRQHGQSDPSERLAQHHARGLAFGALLEHLDPARLPDHGGDATTVIVTIDHDRLTHDLGTAGLLDDNHQLSVAEARRLACTAKILPAVLGGKSEVLDLGRSQRLFSPAQRKALRLRDKTCRAEACTIPATWCDAHHLDPWSRGGTTDLASGILLCNFHHHREHDPAYTTTRLPSGDHRYHRRT